MSERRSHCLAEPAATATSDCPAPTGSMVFRAESADSPSWLSGADHSPSQWFPRLAWLQSLELPPFLESLGRAQLPFPGPRPWVDPPQRLVRRQSALSSFP